MVIEMVIKEINEKEYEKFASKHFLRSFYQSNEWKIVKEKENKKCEFLGFYDNDKLIGVTLVIYLRVLRNKYIAYSSRGPLMEYDKLDEFKSALKEYFKDKNVVFFRMDPPIILATYNKNMEKSDVSDSYKLIDDLKKNGFKHYGFNYAFETMQFRFIHRLVLEENYNMQFDKMSKSTKKNIELAAFKGVKIKTVNIETLDEAYRLFNLSMDRKHLKGFSKELFVRIIDSFENTKLYIAYIDKKAYVNNLKAKIKEIDKEIEELQDRMAHYNVGKKLLKQEELLNNAKEKWSKSLEEAKQFSDKINIASMLTIIKYKEVVSFISGMDNDYRSFCPKYVMYPEMIKNAFDEKLEIVNFLGVKNINDPSDSDYGMYEVKRGFGGETVEYIGEFDLPINNFAYFIYKIKEKIKR